MNDDVRFLSHLAGWCALVPLLAALLPPADAFGIDDLGDDVVRVAPVVRLREPVVLPVAAPKPEPVKATATGGGAARRAARHEAREASPSKFRTKLLGTRGEGRTALVERLWDPDERSGGVDEALASATATGEPARGVRRGGTGDDGPSDNVRLGRFAGGDVDLGSVPVTVELGAVDARDPDGESSAMSLKPYVGALRYCYEKRLMVVPGLGGRVELSLSRERSPRIVVDTTGDEELGRCVLNAARRWELPAGVEAVDVPVVFKSE